MKKFITVTLSIFVVFILCWIGSAYWSVYQIMQAIDHNQPEKISKYIDFPRVQESLKNQVEKKFAKDMGFANENSHYEILGKKLNNLISTQLVETIVTPETIQLLLQGKALHESYSNNLSHSLNSLLSSKDLNKTENLSTVENEDKKSSTAWFSSWNKFEVTILIDQTHTTKVFLEPKDWMWKVVEIKLSD